jgi:hypothetical protein
VAMLPLRLGVGKVGIDVHGKFDHKESLSVWYRYNPRWRAHTRECHATTLKPTLPREASVNRPHGVPAMTPWLAIAYDNSRHAHCSFPMRILTSSSRFLGGLGGQSIYEMGSCGSPHC